MEDMVFDMLVGMDDIMYVFNVFDFFLKYQEVLNVLFFLSVLQLGLDFVLSFIKDFVGKYLLFCIIICSEMCVLDIFNEVNFIFQFYGFVFEVKLGLYFGDEDVFRVQENIFFIVEENCFSESNSFKVDSLVDVLELLIKFFCFKEVFGVVFEGDVNDVSDIVLIFKGVLFSNLKIDSFSK